MGSAVVSPQELPQGFTLDAPVQSAGDDLPAGFTLDTAPPPVPGLGSRLLNRAVYAGVPAPPAPDPPTVPGMAPPEPITQTPQPGLGDRLAKAFTGPGSFGGTPSPQPMFDPWDVALPGAHAAYQALTGEGANKPIADLSALSPGDLGVALAPALGAQYLPGLAGPVQRGILKGTGRALGGLTTPVNLGLLAALHGAGMAAGAPGITGMAAQGLSHLAGLRFSAQMLKQAWDEIPELKKRLDAGDAEGAAELATGIALGTGMGLHSGLGTAKGIVRDVKGAVRGAPQQETPPTQGTGSTVTSSTVPRETTVKPTQSDTVSPATPNPPTAAQPTTPETPGTIEAQLDQLVEGIRRVVMFPKGHGQPINAPTGAPIGLTHDEFGNTYFYRTDLIKKSAIHRAAKDNTLPEILGTAEGLGAPDKSELPPEAPVVVVHAPDGTEVQATATTSELLPVTISAHEPLVPPGGTITVENQAGVVQERQTEAPPEMAQDLSNTLPGVSEQPQASANIPSEPGPPEPEIPKELGTEKQTSGELFRGDWNVPLNEIGRQQVADAAQRTMFQFDRIVAGTKDRHMEAAENFSATNPHAPDPEFSRAFDPMHMGMFEGERITPESLAAVNDRIVNHFNEPIPGVGKYSGSPGEAPLVWSQRLINGVMAEIQRWTPGTKALIVTSGRDIQAVRAWAAAGFPVDGHMDINVLTSKWKTEPGEMMRLDPTADKVEDVTDASLPGIYFARHGETDANGKQTGTSTPETETIAPIRETVVPEPETKPPHKFASTQVELPPDLSSKVIALGMKIPDNALSKPGDGWSETARETEPHITVKYGLHADSPEELFGVLHGQPPITVTLGKTSLFKNDDFDVVKIDVDSPDLHALNEKIADAMPHTDTFPDYHPHVTLAYVKHGEGQRFVGDKSLEGETAIIRSLTFSGKNREQVRIPLTGTATRTPISPIAEPEPIRATVPPATQVVTPTTQIEAPPPITAEGMYESPASYQERKAAAIADFKRRPSGEAGFLDITPLVEAVDKVGEGVSKLVDETRRLLAPQTRGEEAREAAGTFREMGGERMLRQDRAKSLFDQFRNHFYKMQPEEGVYGLGVIDAIENGSTGSLDPKSREFAEAAEESYESRATELVQRGLVKEENLIENYFTHQYKNPDEGKQFVESWLQKRPMTGAEGFRRRRIFPTLREAIDAGLTPKHDNPVDFVLSGLAAMDNSITAHDVFDEWDKAGYLKFVRAGKTPPKGWSFIDDRIFTVRGPRHGAVGLPAAANIEPEDVTVYGRREMGKYAAPEGMAQVANNWLSPNLHKYTAFQLWMRSKNVLNALQLSFSWFHALTTTINASVSDVSLGLEQIARGKPIKGAASVSQGVIPLLSIAKDFIRGKRLVSVWNGTADNVTPLELATVEGLKYAGGSPNQSGYDPDMLMNGLKKAIAQRNISGTAARILNPLLHAEQIMKPIMQKLVPRAKLAAFEKLMINEINEHPNMTQDEARERFARAWDSIDNRFGQLNQRNMLMNNVVRDLMNIVVGRPGWTAGTIRELVPGATTDIAQNLVDVWKGKKTEMSHRTAYLMAVLFFNALMSGVLTAIFTGETPKGMDYVAFRDGGITEDGNPSRQVLPTYVAKDLYSWLTNPKHTAIAKLSQPLQIGSDLWKNRDFYHHEIAGEGGIGLGQYGLNQLTPYSIQGMERNRERQQPIAKTVLPMIGIMPASRRMSMTAAQRILADYNEEHEEQTRAVPTEHSRAMAQLYTMAKRDPSQVQVMGQRFIAEGKITPRDLSKVARHGTRSALVGELESVADVNVVLKAYEAATPEERRQIDRVARGKVARARQTPWTWSDESKRLAMRFFNMQPVRVGNPGPIPP